MPEYAIRWRKNGRKRKQFFVVAPCVNDAEIIAAKSQLDGTDFVAERLLESQQEMSSVSKGFHRPKGSMAYESQE